VLGQWAFRAWTRQTGDIGDTPEIDDIADGLYALPPADFLAARADQASKAPDKAIAKAISALRKPTTAAWAVNQLARQASTELAEALDLGARMREAQRRLRGSELRNLGERRRDLVNKLTRRAAELAGGKLGGEAELQVRNTLGAAMADQELADQVREGRLSKALEHTGFGPLSTTAPVVVDDLADRREKRHERAVTEARKDLEEAEDDVKSARDQVHTATKEHADKAREVEDLRAELRQAERAEQQANQRLRKVTKHLDTVQDVRAAAEQRLKELLE
jgi:hypothetical protein